MAKTFKKLAVWLLTISMLLGMVGIPAFAEEAPASKYPKVTVKLTPDETTKESATIDVNSGKLTREVNAITSGIETDVKDSYGELTAPQSALKFDRNSSTDQKAQKIARELYTDTGHFADPKTITVTGAPEGYPFKYVGFGDYSGHYVSHVRVIFERDEEGNAIKDATATSSSSRKQSTSL